MAREREKRVEEALSYLPRAQAKKERQQYMKGEGSAQQDHQGTGVHAADAPIIIGDKACRMAAFS